MLNNNNIDNKDYKIGELLNNENFLSELITKISKSDIKNLFSNYEILISDEDIENIENSISHSIRSSKELPELYLEKISSGKNFSDSYFWTLIKSQLMSPVEDENGYVKWEISSDKFSEALSIALQMTLPRIFTKITKK